jgi:hypothetical protein
MCVLAAVVHACVVTTGRLYKLGINTAHLTVHQAPSLLCFKGWRVVKIAAPTPAKISLTVAPPPPSSTAAAATSTGTAAAALAGSFASHGAHSAGDGAGVLTRRQRQQRQQQQRQGHAWQQSSLPPSESEPAASSEAAGVDTVRGADACACTCWLHAATLWHAGPCAVVSSTLC